MFVLASASPRRLELLRQVGLDPLVDPADIDETPAPGEPPVEHATRLAREKAFAVAARRPAGDLVLGADTIVTIDGAILGKPDDRRHAGEMLRRLAGRAHEVVTCVHVVGGTAPPAALAVRTEVVFRALDEDEVEDYLDSREWDGKAGGYAIQGRAAGFARTVRGSYTNVVGLPLCEVVEELKRRGVVAARRAPPADGRR